MGIAKSLLRYVGIFQSERQFMDFDFSHERNELRNTVRCHTEEEMRPHVAEVEDTERFPDALFRRWGELGLIVARYP